MKYLPILAALCAAPALASEDIPDQYPASVLYSKPVEVIPNIFSAIGATAPPTYENAGHNNNLSFIVTTEGVVVVNSGGSYLLAQAMHTEIKAVTDQPVVLVFAENGQGHAMLGNSYWAEQGVKIVAHTDAAQEFEEYGPQSLAGAQSRIKERADGTAIVLPTETFDDSYEVTLGGIKIAARHLGPAHSPGDIVVWLPDQSMVISGDMAFHERMLPIFEHTMTPFSPAAFTQGDANHVLSYAKEWLPAANRSGERSGEFNRALDDYLLGATYPLELDLVELQRFWRLPVQYFFNRRLKVVFEPPLPVMEDDEPFVLNGLESFQLKDALLQVLLDHPEGADEAVRLFVSEQKAQGRLPVGAFGDIEFETNRVQAEDLAKEIRFVSGSPQQDLEVNIEFDVLGEGKPVRLMGWLTKNYQSGLVRFRSGKIRSQDYLAAWIDHLCCAVMGHGKTTHIIGYDRKEGVVHQTLQPIGDALQAKSLLAELVRLFYQGMTAPLPYFPKTALAGVEAGFSRGKWVDDEEKSLKKMADTFNDSFAFTGEGRDTYISRIWSKWDDALAAESRMYSTLVLQAARLAAADLEDQE